MNLRILISLFILLFTSSMATAQEAPDAQDAATNEWLYVEIGGRVLMPDGTTPAGNVNLSNGLRYMIDPQGNRVFLQEDTGMSRYRRHFKAKTDENGWFTASYPLRVKNGVRQEGDKPIQIVAYSDDMQQMFWGYFSEAEGRGRKIVITLQQTTPISTSVEIHSVDEPEMASSLDSAMLMITLNIIDSSGSRKSQLNMVQPLSLGTVEFHAPPGEYELLIEEATSNTLRPVRKPFSVTRGGGVKYLGDTLLRRSWRVDDRMPEWSIHGADGTLRGGDPIDANLTVADLAGTWTLVRFSQLACENCMERFSELPLFLEEFEDASLPFEVIAFYGGGFRETVADVDRTLQSHGLARTFPIVVDDFDDRSIPGGSGSRTFDSFGITNAPFDVLIAPDGTIRELSANALPTLRKRLEWEYVPVAGVVLDADGKPAAGHLVTNIVDLHVDRDGTYRRVRVDEGGDYQVIFTETTDAEGRFSGHYPLFKSPRGGFASGQPIRLTAYSANLDQIGWGVFPSAPDARGSIRINLERTVAVTATLSIPWLGTQGGNRTAVQSTHYLSWAIRPRSLGVTATVMAIRQLYSMDELMQPIELMVPVVPNKTYGFELGVNVTGLRRFDMEVPVPADVEVFHLGYIIPERLVDIGRPMPEWQIGDGDGVTRGNIPVTRDLKITDFRGRWLLLVFGSTLCTVCMGDEFPALTEFYEKAAQPEYASLPFDVVLVHGGFIGNIERLRADFEKREKPWLPFPVVVDTYDKSAYAGGRTFDLCGVSRTPTHILINDQGEVVAMGVEAMQMLKQQFGLDF